MKQSGTKLVVGLTCLALAAGALSWWYHFGARHRATEFWGGVAAPLIARPSQVEVLELFESASDPRGDWSLRLDLGRPYGAAGIRELSQARGMVHLRHALMSDLNYQWNEVPQPQSIDWRWCLRFHDSQGEALVVLAEDLATIGLVVGGGEQVQVVSCRPMVDSLQHYFEDLGLISASTAP